MNQENRTANPPLHRNKGPTRKNRTGKIPGRLKWLTFFTSDTPIAGEQPDSWHLNWIVGVQCLDFSASIPIAGEEALNQQEFGSESENRPFNTPQKSAIGGSCTAAGGTGADPSTRDLEMAEIDQRCLDRLPTKAESMAVGMGFGPPECRQAFPNKPSQEPAFTAPVTSPPHPFRPSRDEPGSDPSREVIGALSRFFQVIRGPVIRIAPTCSRRVRQRLEDSNSRFASAVVLGPGARGPEMHDAETRERRFEGRAGEG